jgi:hypothetical protein
VVGLLTTSGNGPSRRAEDLGRVPGEMVRVNTRHPTLGVDHRLPNQTEHEVLGRR